MADLIVIAAVALLLFSIGRYIRREKKKGKICVGCPYGGSCSGGCGQKK